MAENKNILIISPHPDDDVIGMGGSIALKASQNATLTIIYVTNGSGSIRVGEFSDFSTDEIIKLRKEEAERSLSFLVDNKEQLEQVFLGFSSQEIFNNPEIYTTKLKEILNKKRYDEIYLPYPNDRHQTHKTTAKLSLDTIREAKIKSLILAYETWDSIPVGDNTTIVDISGVYKKKLAAIGCHRSQCAIAAFDEGIVAKNRYNAVFHEINSKKKIEYAELFLKLH